MEKDGVDEAEYVITFPLCGGLVQSRKKHKKDETNPKKKSAIISPQDLEIYQKSYCMNQQKKLKFQV